MYRNLTLAFVCLLAAISVHSQDPEAAAVPRLVNFSGVVTDETAKPRTGSVALTFAVYGEQYSRTPLWQETQNAQTDALGHFTVHLGAATRGGMPLELFTSGRPLWVGVRSRTDNAPEQEHVRLVSVPYALKASDADTLGGIPASAFVTRDSLPALGTASASVASPAAGVRSTPAAIGPSVGGGGGANFIPVWLDSANLGNSLFYQSGTSIGLGTISPAAALHLLTPAAATKGLIVQGFTSQSANLQEWQNSGGAVLGSVNSAGGAFFPTGGIGDLAPQPGSILYLRHSFGNPTVAITNGLSDIVSIAPTAATSNSIDGESILSSISGAFGTSATVYGTVAQTISSVVAGGTVSILSAGRYNALNSGTGATTNLFGGSYTAGNTGGGTAVNHYGAQFLTSVTGGSHSTNLIGALIGTPTISGGGVATNAYGLFVQNIAGATTKNYSIYSAGGTSYFAGSVGIGALSPAAMLEVNGTAKFDGLVTFAAGQTFPGTGTVTSVGSGVGLTGGPITTSGTLSIDTTIVPRLNVSNTFTVPQFVNGYVDAFPTGNSVALYGFNTSTDSTHPTLYLSNDDSTSAGDLVFQAVGTSFGGNCTIDVSGNLFCTGTLQPALHTATNQTLGLYTVTSPENWMEDYGSAQLSSGVATIQLNRDFAQAVNTTSGYKVFVTPDGDCAGVYVTNRTPTSFEVHELKGGTSNVSFDYRIVAHRVGFESARLPDISGKLHGGKGVPQPTP